MHNDDCCVSVSKYFRYGQDDQLEHHKNNRLNEEVGIILSSTTFVVANNF